MNVRELILAKAKSFGFERAVIASLEPLEAEKKFYETWLSLGYAASMEYLKRNPIKRLSPQLICPEAYSVIVLFAPYYSCPPEDPGPEYGRIAAYAVGQDYHNVLKSKVLEFKNSLEKDLGRSLLGKCFTDDVELYEQALARRSGLGFTGKNRLLIGPKLLGSYHFVVELFTDIELEADEPYHGTCGNCFRCGINCPTNAILDAGMLDANLCISFLTIENKGIIPKELRPKLGNWLFGCDICQIVCPYNQKAPQYVWQEFSPSSGAGHYLNLLDLLKIKDKKEFMKLFAHTALSRAKRRGLLRNALTVISNRLPERGPKAILDFLQDECESKAEVESDLVLLDHAVYALSCYPDGAITLKMLWQTSSNNILKNLINEYL